MKGDEIAEELSNAIEEHGNRGKTFGQYHPSTISGCPLKAFLNWITDNETQYNRWLFQGSAVHFFLQEHPDLLQKALNDAGYHPLDTDYEVHKLHSINEYVTITGTCDILTHTEDERAVIDIKYSSIPPTSNHGRLYKYASQVNTYANMFNADEWGLLMINSKSDHIPDDIVMIDQETDDENFEKVKEKATGVHQALSHFGYPKGERFAPSELDAKMQDVWDTVFNFISQKDCPSYEKECQYCDHKQYCPVKQGEVGGLRGLGD